MMFQVGILVAFLKCHFYCFLIIRARFRKVADLGLPLLAAQISETESNKNLEGGKMGRKTTRGEKKHELLFQRINAGQENCCCLQG